MQNKDLFLWFPAYDLDLRHAADTSLSSDFIKERHRSLNMLWKQSLRIRKSNKFQNVQLSTKRRSFMSLTVHVHYIYTKVSEARFIDKNYFGQFSLVY